MSRTLKITLMTAVTALAIALVAITITPSFF
jgi:hypothetical protein